MPKEINHLKAQHPKFLEDAEKKLSILARGYFKGLATKSWMIYPFK